MTNSCIFSFLFLALIGCEHSAAKPKPENTESATQQVKTQVAEASKPTTAETKDTLEKIRQKYVKYEQVNLKIKKTTFLEVLDKTKTSPQMIFVTNKGEIRVDTNDVPKSSTILAGNTAYVIDEADPEFGGPVRVLVSRNQNLKQSQAFLTVLFGQGDISKYYAVTQKNAQTYSLVAVDKNLSAQKVELKVDPENLQITQIIYWDELKNKITLAIETTAFQKTRNAELFKYKIPKDAEVTEI